MFGDWLRYCSGLRPKFMQDYEFARNIDSKCLQFILDHETNPKNIRAEHIATINGISAKMFNAMKDL